MSSPAMDMVIRECGMDDLPAIYEIINEAAGAYKGVIPGDCFSEPYMPLDELIREIDDGVRFWGIEQDGRLIGVMGIQDVRDVTLIRHAYVSTNHRNKGIGSRLLDELRRKTSQPILMGTWKDAAWAIGFYEKHGFRALPAAESSTLLRRYWKISERQIEASVVLAEEMRSGDREVSGLPID